jgi:hypothetical protein
LNDLEDHKAKNAYKDNTTDDATALVDAASAFCLSACSLRIAAMSGGVVELAEIELVAELELVKLTVGVLERVGVTEMLLVGEFVGVCDLVGETEDVRDLVGVGEGGG